MRARVWNRVVLAALILITLCGASGNVSGDYQARVVGVSDGDTITVLRDGHKEVRIRLHGIDSPELHQAFGEKAKQYTSSLCFGKDVRIVVMDTDRYGRMVADVYLTDGNLLNRMVVCAGYAWWFAKYSPEDRTLSECERAARAEKRGLWVDSNAVAPWMYRQASR